MANFLILTMSENTTRLQAIKAFVEKNGHAMTFASPENVIILQDSEWPIVDLKSMTDFDMTNFLATNGTSEAPPADPEQTVVQELPAIDLEKPEENEEFTYGICPECGEPGIGTERSIDGKNFCANHHRFPRPDTIAAENEEETCQSENEESCSVENEEGVTDAVEIEQDGMVQAFSRVIVKRINGDEPIDALIDTGSDLCVLDVSNLIVGDLFAKFTYGDSTYKVPSYGTKTIVATNGEETRPVVRFDISLDGVSYDKVDFTLTDRPEGSPKVLIGREFLAANDLLVQS